MISLLYIFPNYWRFGFIYLAISTILLCRKSGRIKGDKRRYSMIIINIDIMLAKRKMSVTELTEKVGLTMANVSLLKNGKVKAIKLSTLNKICEVLECQPGDILEYSERNN